MSQDPIDETQFASLKKALERWKLPKLAMNEVALEAQERLALLDSYVEEHGPVEVGLTRSKEFKQDFALRYPDEVQFTHTSGRVPVGFWLGKDGRFEDMEYEPERFGWMGEPYEKVSELITNAKSAMIDFLVEELFLATDLYETLAHQGLPYEFRLDGRGVEYGRPQFGRLVVEDTRVATYLKVKAPG